MRGRLQTNRSDMIVGAIVSQRYGPSKAPGLPLFLLHLLQLEGQVQKQQASKQNSKPKWNLKKRVSTKVRCRQEQPERLEPETARHWLMKSCFIKKFALFQILELIINTICFSDPYIHLHKCEDISRSRFWWISCVGWIRSHLTKLPFEEQ